MNMRNNVCSGLNRVFHEPSRLGIMSALCGSANGLTFNELKAVCGLTDGNLSRHLKTLQDAGAVLIRKAFEGRKPRTTVAISDLGREAFVEYLKTLEEVLRQASEAVALDEASSPVGSMWSRSLGVGGPVAQN